MKTLGAYKVNEAGKVGKYNIFQIELDNPVKDENEAKATIKELLKDIPRKRRTYILSDDPITLKTVSSGLYINYILWIFKGSQCYFFECFSASPSDSEVVQAINKIREW